MAILGCIADDFTGATDLASMLVEGECELFKRSECRKDPCRKMRMQSWSRSNRGAFLRPRPSHNP